MKADDDRYYALLEGLLADLPESRRRRVNSLAPPGSDPEARRLAMHIESLEHGRPSKMRFATHHPKESAREAMRQHMSVQDRALAEARSELSRLLGSVAPADGA